MYVCMYMYNICMCTYVCMHAHIYMQCARLFVRVDNNNIFISALQPRLLDDDHDTDSLPSVQRPRWAAV